MTIHQSAKIRDALERMAAPVQDDKLLRTWIKGNPVIARKACMSMPYVGLIVWQDFLASLKLREVQKVVDAK